MATSRKMKDRKGLHIEADGCIINVYEGLHNTAGCKVTAIEILPDDHYVGERMWRVTPKVYNVRVIQMVKVRK